MNDLWARFGDPRSRRDLMGDESRPDRFPFQFSLQHRSLETNSPSVVVTIDGQCVWEGVIKDLALEVLVLACNLVVWDVVACSTIIGSQSEERAEEEDKTFVAWETKPRPQAT